MYTHMKKYVDISWERKALKNITTGSHVQFFEGALVVVLAHFVA